MKPSCYYVRFSSFDSLNKNHVHQRFAIKFHEQILELNYQQSDPIYVKMILPLYFYLIHEPINNLHREVLDACDFSTLYCDRVFFQIQKT
jgi:hypothetical protein